MNMAFDFNSLSLANLETVVLACGDIAKKIEHDYLMLIDTPRAEKLKLEMDLAYDRYYEAMDAYKARRRS
jgi:hypothetical protein